MAAKTQRVKVLNPFYVKGSGIAGIDSVIDLPMAEALEMRSSNKVEFVASDTKLEQTDKLRPRSDASGPAATSEGVDVEAKDAKAAKK